MFKVEPKLSVNLAHRTCDVLLQKEYENLPGLMQGNSGIVLYLAFFYKVVRQDEKVLKRIEHLIYRIIKQINSLALPDSLASGYSGVGWLFCVLQDLNLLEVDDSQIEKAFAGIIINDYLNNKEPQENFDLLYGILGHGVFLSHHRLRGTEYHTKFITKIINDFKDFDLGESNVEELNLGLAHGIAGIGLFLLNNFEIDTIHLVKISRIFANTLSRYTSTSSTEWSIFPNSFKKGAGHYERIENSESRYAWCHGDLGILLFLVQVNMLFPEIITSKHIQVLANACNHRTLENSYVHKAECYDIGFCHGLSGIVYLQTKINLICRYELLKTNHYWINLLEENMKIVLDLNNTEVSETGNHQDMIGLLGGLTGAGLVHLSLLTNDYFWDGCLLLNFIENKKN